MSNVLAAASEGRGSRPSPRWVPAILFAVLAAIVGLAVGRFLTYTDTPTVALPAVEVPDDQQVTALQAAADAAPQDPAAWQELGIAATRQAIATADPAWYGVAQEAFATALDLDPDDVFTEIARGQLVLSLHEFDEALEIGREVTTDAPATADAWGVLVDAQVELGMYEDAATSLQTMLDLRPDLPALARASYLRQLNGDLPGAIVAMRQADTAGSNALSSNSSVATLIGDLLLQEGDLDEALDAYQRAETPAAAAGLARIAAAQGDLPRAEQILLDLSRRIPVPAVVTALAEVQRRAGDEEGLADTVELVRTIAVLQQENGQTVDLELALFESSFGDPERGLELAQAAYAARPDNVFAAGALAWAYHQADQQGPAQELAAQATRLGTVDTPLELRMAIVTGEGREALLDRNPLAEDLFLP